MATVYHQTADVTPSTFATALLAQLGLPTSGEWQTVVNQWVASEGGFDAALAQRTHNPLNARCEFSEGSWSPWPVDGPNASCTASGFVAWPSLNDAVQAYSSQLSIGSYANIKNASSPSALKAAIIASPWAAGHYGNGDNWSNAGGVVSTTSSSSSGASGTGLGGFGYNTGGSNNGVLDTLMSELPPPFNIIYGIFFGNGLQGILEAGIALLIAVFLVLKGIGTLTNTKAADIGRLASAVSGLGAASYASRVPAGMTPVETRRSGRLPGGGHVSYTYRQTRRGREIGGEPAPIGPLVPVDDAIREPAPAAPSASSETPRVPVSEGQTITVQRRGTRQEPRQELTRDEMRTQFVRKLGDINKTFKRSYTPSEMDKKLARAARRQLDRTKQISMSSPEHNRGRRLE